MDAMIQKRVGTCLVAVGLTFALSACGGQTGATPPPETTPPAPVQTVAVPEPPTPTPPMEEPEVDGASSYTVGPYTFTLTMPEEFLAQVNVLADKSLDVNEKTSEAAGLGGNLFTIMWQEDGAYKDYLPSFETLYEGEQGDLVVLYPTDVQFAPEAMDGYTQLQEQIADILVTFEIG